MGWIEKYMDYSSDNEASAFIHYWVGLNVIGASLKRNVSLSRGHYVLYPNLWTIIVAPSGSKKTTACSIGYNLLSKLDCIKMLPDKGSPEGLALALSSSDSNGDANAQALIYAPELSNFMDSRKHNEGLVPFLLRIADCPDKWTYQTKGGGVVALKNVAVSFLGATAPDLMRDSIPASALKSGFLARFICVADEACEKVIPFPSKDTHLEGRMIEELERISLLKGEMVLPKDCQEWFVAFYYRHKAHLYSESSEKLRAYLERKPDYLLKIAMILSISSTNILMYNIKCMNEAEKRLDELECNLLKLYLNIEASAGGKEQINITALIERSGGSISYESLFTKLSTSMQDPSSLRKMVTTLCEAKVIRIDKEKGKTVLRLVKSV